MVASCFAWDDVIDVHLTFICSTQLTSSTITHEHALSLFSVSSGIEVI
jgi:hypothetical protein